MLYFIKILLSVIIIVMVSEISKRSGVLGGLIASLPLTSILAISWLYLETRDLNKVSNLSYSIFWMVIPSLLFFLILPALLKRDWPFYAALLMSGFFTACAYYLANKVYLKLGLSI